MISIDNNKQGDLKMSEKQMVNVGLASTVSCKTLSNLKRKSKKDLEWNPSLRGIDKFKAFMIFLLFATSILTLSFVLTKVTIEAQLDGDYVKIIKETK